MLNGFAASSCRLRGVFLLAGAAIANLAEHDLLGADCQEEVADRVRKPVAHQRGALRILIDDLTSGAND